MSLHIKLRVFSYKTKWTYEHGIIVPGDYSAFDEPKLLAFPEILGDIYYTLEMKNIKERGDQ